MKTTTDAKNWRFHFTVTDLARFLGKSPVTVRGWEQRGLIKLPRDDKGDRKLSADDVRDVAQTMRTVGRITEQRLRLVDATITMIQLIERENNG